MNAAAIASIAAVVCADGVWHARCFKEKRARNRRARGTVSEVKAFLKVSTVVSMTGEASSGLGSMAEGDMFASRPSLQFKVTEIHGTFEFLGDRIFGGVPAGRRNLNS